MKPQAPWRISWGPLRPSISDCQCSESTQIVFELEHIMIHNSTCSSSTPHNPHSIQFQPDNSSLSQTFNSWNYYNNNNSNYYNYNYNSAHTLLKVQCAVRWPALMYDPSCVSHFTHVKDILYVFTEDNQNLYLFLFNYELLLLAESNKSATFIPWLFFRSWTEFMIKKTVIKIPLFFAWRIQCISGRPMYTASAMVSWSPRGVGLLLRFSSFTLFLLFFWLGAPHCRACKEGPVS